MCGAVSKNAEHGCVSAATRPAEIGSSDRGPSQLRCGQRDDAEPASNRMRSCECDLGEPLERNPVCPAKVCRARIGGRTGVVIENPATKRNV